MVGRSWSRQQQPAQDPFSVAALTLLRVAKSFRQTAPTQAMSCRRSTRTQKSQTTLPLEHAFMLVSCHCGGRPWSTSLSPHMLFLFNFNPREYTVRCRDGEQDFAIILRTIMSQVPFILRSVLKGGTISLSKSAQARAPLLFVYVETANGKCEVSGFLLCNVHKRRESRREVGSH